MMQLMAQMVEMQKENIELRRELLNRRTETPHVKTPERPSIGLDTTEAEWALFIDSWTRYKSMCGLADPAVIRNELRTTCTADANRLLFELVGPEILKSATEEFLLEKIKLVTVKGLHKEVQRQIFHSMVQKEGELITHFFARLRGQAKFCDFRVKCPNEPSCRQQVNYSDDMVAGQLISGLANPEHQNKVLSEAATLTTLELKFNRLVCLETTEKSTPHFPKAPDTIASSHTQRSVHARQPKDKKSSPTPQNIRPCVGCGKTTHPNGSMNRKYCPAIQLECHFCGSVGHIKKVCRKFAATGKDAKSKIAKSESFSFANTSSESDPPHRVKRRGKSQPATTPHLEWDGKQFQVNSPEAPPSITVEVTMVPEAHAKFGRQLRNPVSQVNHHILAIADTGAQTCSCGPEIQELLGYPDGYLIPTTHRIRGITENQLQIKGVLFLRIKVGKKETRQAVYVSKNTSGFYLSQTALKDLGLLHPNFPTPPSHNNSIKDTNKMAPCGCPHRAPVPPKPEVIPFKPTETNRLALEQWLMEHFKSSAFNTCPHQQLQVMTGKPLDITFDRDAKPSAVHTPIPVPHHWKKKVKEDLDRDVRLGIIEPVPAGTPTLWCSRMVVAPKKDGTPRRTVDLQKLNAATMRETHHTPSPFNQVSVVPARTKKTILDAWNGYHSLLLSENARDATTFITEWGRYRYLRAPQGFHASGDGYTHRFDNITVDTPRMTRCIDDTLLWDSNVESAFWHTVEYITHCGKNGIVFNPEKFHFACDEVEFAGFLVTANGFRPTRKMTEAILHFPTPTNITDVRSWFGLVNQASYAFSQAEVMAPFRELLRTKNRKFYWDETLEKIFQESKRVIVAKIKEGVQSFELNRTTGLATDYSKTGISYFLFQKHCSCTGEPDMNCGEGHWKLILSGSRFNNDAESRYAPVEGEALALVYGLESCRMFVLGCPDLLVTVDHMPLVKIFSDQALENISNPRLLNLKEKSLMYRFKIKHRPGKLNLAPDCASRYPAGLPPRNPTRTIDNAVKAAFASMYAGDSKLKAITWERIVAAAATDEECRTLAAVIQKGFPDSRNELPPTARVFWPMRENLYCLEGVVINESRILIPRQLRAEVLEALHSAHQGVNGMLANAKQRLFWPGLGASVRQTRSQCRICNTIAPSQPKEPLMPSADPEFPFQLVAVDFADIQGRHYLVYADRYTGWVEITLMSSGKAKTICDTLRSWFGTYGAPEEISSDGGPPFDSLEYNTFLRNWGVKKRTSSAYYAQSNGRAELAVKTAKRILADNTDSGGHLNHDRAARALLTHRNTPVQDLNMSPAMMLYGRVIRDHLPVLRDKYQIRPQWKEIAELRETALARRHMRNKQYYNEHSRPLQELQVGDFVRVQNQDGHYPRRWTKTGRIVETRGNRQYQIRVDGSNRITLRNRRFIRRIHPVLNGPNLPEPGTSNPPDPQLHQTQPPEEEMDTDQGVGTTSIEEPMDVDDIDTTGQATTTLTRSRQSSRRVVRPPRHLSPQMRGKSHRFSGTGRDDHVNQFRGHGGGEGRVEMEQ